MTGNVVTVNVQVVQESEQTKKINRILLSIIDHLKTAGWMGIPLRGHRDDSQYHAEVGEPSTHAGVGNFVVLLNFAVHQGNKDLEDHSKNCSGKEPISPKQLRIIFWTAVVILWQTPSQAKLNRVIFFSVLCDEASDSSNKGHLSFCLICIDENGDIVMIFLNAFTVSLDYLGHARYVAFISNLLFLVVRNIHCIKCIKSNAFLASLYF